MDSVIDIDWLVLAIFFSLLAVPLLCDRYYQLDLGKDIFISVARMTLQLILVGIYLEYLFTINSLIVNLLWLILMLLIGSSAIISKAKLPASRLMLPITTGLVTLPGMMTGQILGGASPIIAIKYQLMIMVAIFVMMTISIVSALKLTVRNCISKEGRILVHIPSTK
ncbi:ABC transporter permease [Vibrio sp. M250220]|uniref:ABC transporter permease n=1 Tax=Vibrio sp. M250220 TaxID=3020894 RepID=UPI002F3F35A3